MRFLLIKAQDIKEISLALLDQDQGSGFPKLVFESKTTAQPEEYLKEISLAVREWGIGFEELSGVIVVTGPGSFTSSRVSLTIANTIGFTHGLPIVPIENNNHLKIKELIMNLDLNDLPQVNTFAQPTYNQPPQIGGKKMD
ncbi:hypothetical protein ACFLZY_01330 [Patescibacteria group bacterium]